LPYLANFALHDHSQSHTK